MEYKDIPVTVNRNIDILFVIDDSGSMADKQNNLAANFPNFINVLDTIEGGLPDVHIGVASSDMGTKGVEGAPGAPIPGTGGCTGAGDDGALQIGTAPVTGKFISDVRGTMPGQRLRNYTGDLADAFSAMARLGAAGCGFEQHLHSMQRALQNTTANAGFLRPDAFLAVIFIADEDDCSMQNASLLAGGDGPLGPLTSFRCTQFGVTCAVGGATTDQMKVLGIKDQCAPNDAAPYLAKVSAFVSYLKDLKKDDPSKVIVAGIMGNTEPFAVENRQIGAQTSPALAHSCTYNSPTGAQVADPPIRLKFFLDQFPNRSTFTTICQPDLSAGLQQIAQLLKTALGNPCIEGNLAEPVDCSVSDVSNYLKPNQSETVLPKCNAEAPANPSNTPCWRISKDPVKCPMGDQYILDIQRGGTTPPPDTHVIAYCVTEDE